MHFRITLDCDNDAFQPQPFAETARILRAIADRLDTVHRVGLTGGRESFDYGDGGWTEHYQTVLDINGNDVGRYAFKRNQKDL